MTDNRPLLVDLYCGIGGAAMGYYRAGFDIIGVDHAPQLQYPFPFMRSDALEFLDKLPQSLNRRKVVAVHASPPCQKFVALGKGMGHWKGFDSSPDLLAQTRELLMAKSQELNFVYVIENVPGAPMKSPITLCGSMFDLRIERGYLQRHRWFESNLLQRSGVGLMVPGPCRHEGQAIGVYGNGRGGSTLKHRTANAEEARQLMGIDWASRTGITQAVPPAYTEHIGKQLMETNATFAN